MWRPTLPLLFLWGQDLSAYLPPCAPRHTFHTVHNDSEHHERPPTSSSTFSSSAGTYAALLHGGTLLHHVSPRNLSISGSLGAPSTRRRTPVSPIFIENVSEGYSLHQFYPCTKEDVQQWGEEKWKSFMDRGHEEETGAVGPFSSSSGTSSFADGFSPTRGEGNGARSNSKKHTTTTQEQKEDCMAVPPFPSDHFSDQLSSSVSSFFSMPPSTTKRCPTTDEIRKGDDATPEGAGSQKEGEVVSWGHQDSGVASTYGSLPFEAHVVYTLGLFHKVLHGEGGATFSRGGNGALSHFAAAEAIQTGIPYSTVLHSLTVARARVDELLGALRQRSSPPKTPAPPSTMEETVVEEKGAAHSRNESGTSSWKAAPSETERLEAPSLSGPAKFFANLFHVPGMDKGTETTTDSATVTSSSSLSGSWNASPPLHLLLTPRSFSLAYGILGIAEVLYRAVQHEGHHRHGPLPPPKRKTWETTITKTPFMKKKEEEEAWLGMGSPETWGLLWCPSQAASLSAMWLMHAIHTCHHAEWKKWSGETWRARQLLLHMGQPPPPPSTSTTSFSSSSRASITVQSSGNTLHIRPSSPFPRVVVDIMLTRGVEVDLLPGLGALWRSAREWCWNDGGWETKNGCRTRNTSPPMAVIWTSGCDIEAIQRWKKVWAPQGARACPADGESQKMDDDEKEENNKRKAEARWSSALRWRALLVPPLPQVAIPLCLPFSSSVFPHLPTPTLATAATSSSSCCSFSTPTSPLWKRLDHFLRLHAFGPVFPWNLHLPGDAAPPTAVAPENLTPPPKDLPHEGKWNEWWYHPFSFQTLPRTQHTTPPSSTMTDGGVLVVPFVHRDTTNVEEEENRAERRRTTWGTTPTATATLSSSTSQVAAGARIPLLFVPHALLPSLLRSLVTDLPQSFLGHSLVPTEEEEAEEAFSSWSANAPPHRQRRPGRKNGRGGGGGYPRVGPCPGALAKEVAKTDLLEAITYGTPSSTTGGGGAHVEWEQVSGGFTPALTCLGLGAGGGGGASGNPWESSSSEEEKEKGRGQPSSTSMGLTTSSSLPMRGRRGGGASGCQNYYFIPSILYTNMRIRVRRPGSREEEEEEKRMKSSTHTLVSVPSTSHARPTLPSSRFALASPSSFRRQVRRVCEDVRNHLKNAAERQQEESGGEGIAFPCFSPTLFLCGVGELVEPALDQKKKDNDDDNVEAKTASSLFTQQTYTEKTEKNGSMETVVEGVHEGAVEPISYVLAKEGLEIIQEEWRASMAERKVG